LNDWTPVPFCDEIEMNRTAYLDPRDNPLMVKIGRISLAEFNQTVFFKSEFDNYYDTKEQLEEIIKNPSDYGLMKTPISHVQYELVTTPETADAMFQTWALFFGVSTGIFLTVSLVIYDKLSK
jgi:hypothetical protein